LPPPPAPDAGDLARAAAILSAAKRPVILAGGGARACEKGLQKLAEALDAPLVQTVHARGIMYQHPLTVPASPSLDAVRAVISGSDAILALGTELGPTDYDMYARGGLPDLSKMIRVDIDAAQLARHIAALPIRADAALFVQGLLPLLPPRAAHRTGPQRASETRADARAELAQLDPAMPQRLTMIEAIREALPRAQIIGDSTQPIYAANLFYDHDRAGGWFNAATGFGALGYGVGAAIGAAIGGRGLAQPPSRTVCIMGDEGLQFTAAELRTAVDENLPITFIIWNNSAYGEIAAAMRAADMPVLGCHPSPLGHAPLAEACGLPFVSISMDDDLLHWALTQQQAGPCLIEIRAEDA
jgi:acetolactate synthase-1/2/3 large subunit